MTTLAGSFAFETERLLLRPRTLADTDACIEMDRDPDVTRFVNGPWSDPAAHRAFVEKRTSGPWPQGMGYWTILLREDAATFVGWVLLIPVDAVGPEIEIGWRLRQRFWGKGFATEAARPVLAHAFEILGLDEVIAEIAPENLGSLKVAEKIGLKRRGLIEHGEMPAERFTLKSVEFSPSVAAGPG
ncbi:GNAT family N-acetyltransferase [Bosea sp. (in: a-proteobacteria)]|jgi:RimJ/RimL family protein N-acetyltransferase|uniref:GNAT family N-acetyltransferase n=1 Tax=Bosea sp. (in: a-proteobacteria) TaxID=1871050 RepID=UPI003F72B43A